MEFYEQKTVRNRGSVAAVTQKNAEQDKGVNRKCGSSHARFPETPSSHSAGGEEKEVQVGETGVKAEENPRRTRGAHSCSGQKAQLQKVPSR